MTSLSLPAYGKINLSLDVLGLRSDGYHEIASVMQSIRLADRLTFATNSTGKITFTCSEPSLAAEDNLVVRAARLLQERFSPGQGADIFLEKRIPIAAGLGGGSTDAAAALRGLNCLWDLGLTTSALISLGSELGADVPFCLVGGTALAEGMGERLTLLPPAPQLRLVLVKPDKGLGAGDVYRQWDQAGWISHSRTPVLLAALAAPDAGQLLFGLGNDLEKAVLELHPKVGEIIEEFRGEGALKAMVSGSGPTVLGIIDNESKGLALVNRFRRQYKEVYLTSTI